MCEEVKLVASLIVVLLCSFALADEERVTVVIEKHWNRLSTDTWNNPRNAEDRHFIAVDRTFRSGRRTHRSGVTVWYERPEVWPEVGERPERGRHRFTYVVWTNRPDRVVSEVKVRLRFKWRYKYPDGASYVRAMNEKYHTQWEAVHYFKRELDVSEGSTYEETVTLAEWKDGERENLFWRDFIWRGGMNFTHKDRTGFRYQKDLKVDAKLIYIKHRRK
jgi:hypothetical protein